MEETFFKYHGLGNDYLVLDPARFQRSVTPGVIQKLCDRHTGIGADGILYGPLQEQTDSSTAAGRGDEYSKSGNEADEVDVLCRFGLAIFNPDGSEAEKSGNGLRIFARYLQDSARVSEGEFTLATSGGEAKCTVWSDDRSIRVEMGQVSFRADTIPVEDEQGEVLNRELETSEGTLTYHAASVGNPHCIIDRKSLSEEETCDLGPLIENHNRFPCRTNVQFMEVIDNRTIHIQIWERGAGYTLTSGTSACACAAVATRLGYCTPPVTVRMPGGTMEIEVGADYNVALKAPVTAVCQGAVCPEVYG